MQYDSNRSSETDGKMVLNQSGTLHFQEYNVLRINRIYSNNPNVFITTFSSVLLISVNVTHMPRNIHNQEEIM